MLRTLDLNFQGIEKTIASFLIETSEGPILIETGPYSCFKQLQKLVESYGYSLQDIQHVFITHIHLDHAGGAWALAERGATVYLHPFGVAHMADPTKLWKSAQLIYGDKMEFLWGKMEAIKEDQLRPVMHGESINIGERTITAWHTPGHANHHIAWQMEREVFCGDVAGVKIDRGPVVPPCPPPDINLEKWRDSIALIKDLQPEKLHLTHFGEIVEVEAQLNELWEILNNWAQWIKPRFENNELPQEIIPEFQRYTEQQLKALGLNESEIKKYETANPSWMSVAGLLRYWKKKKEAGE
ncbi:MBL fold metallo-hydrolase [Fulvivirgaceae bacterium BMA12]|uniref:MBL fold metallo-hydrolase n=1 Tax=Agaribacillus aureus TaxID=3051825 RepID=A0ABT8L738_9BACT|nr:MBL fold metallo-hydrolase [Fulvivirgaceae bacterium BMA12]